MRTQTGDATEVVSVDSLNSYSNWLRQDRRERRRFVNGARTGSEHPRVLHGNGSVVPAVSLCRPCGAVGGASVLVVRRSQPCRVPTRLRGIPCIVFTACSSLARHSIIIEGER